MSTKHTPGRWWVSGEDSDEVHCSIFTKDVGQNVNISLVKPPYVGGIIPAEQLKANARLIASAPDLLDALQAFPGFTDDATAGDAWLEKMRAAIAKAIG